MTQGIDYEIDGVSLTDDPRWGIADFAPLEVPPSYRGESLTIPFRGGQLFRPRVVDGRTITFAMYVTQYDANGENPSAEQLLDNWRTIRSLFWGSGGAQLAITKTFDTPYIEATGYGYFVGGLEPVNHGLDVLTFTADVYMPQPYFLAASVSLGTLSGTTDLTGDIVGHAASPSFTLTFSGANPSLVIKKGSQTLSTVSYSGTVSGSLVVAFPTFTATGTGVHLVSAQQTPWADLDPAATSAVVASGTVAVAYNPAYL